MCTVAKEEPDVPTGKILFPVDNSNPENAQTALLREDFYKRGICSHDARSRAIRLNFEKLSSNPAKDRSSYPKV